MLASNIIIILHNHLFNAYVLNACCMQDTILDWGCNSEQSRPKSLLAESLN